MRLSGPALSSAALILALSSAAVAAPTEVTIKMNALNGSNQSGTAVLTQEPNGVKVVVKLDHAGGTDEPTHIHLGTCKNINKSPEYALLNTKDGQSQTTVPGITLAQILGKPYAVNVHKSLKDLATYVSCGDIK